MEKPFFEVFPQVEMRSDLRDLFEEVDVTKITTTTRKDLIRIYILSHNLIAKEDIYEAEKAIRKSIFGGQNIEVKIYERFVLSSQYNVKTLFETYKDSILEECRHYDHVIFNMLRRAEVSFVDTDFVLFTVEDTLINRSKETDLLMVLDKIFNIRCGMHATVEVAFRESAVRDGGNEDDERIRRNVREICCVPVFWRRKRSRRKETVRPVRGCRMVPRTGRTMGSKTGMGQYRLPWRSKRTRIFRVAPGLPMAPRLPAAP